MYKKVQPKQKTLGQRTSKQEKDLKLAMAETTKRYALVTGANKGIGFGICKQLASNGITVVLTSRDEKRGLEAVRKLHDYGLVDHVVFHQLDVTDQASISSLAEFLRTQFGKLDILVNNAGIGGAEPTNLGGDFLRDLIMGKEEARRKWKEQSAETPELTEECLNINYYGPKRMVEALVPLMQPSDSPTIVNVSSSMGLLKNIPGEEMKGVLDDVNNLTEERVDEVLREYVKDFKEGSWDTKGWPHCFSAYTLSKASLNAYTRMIAKKYPSFCINCVCPGFVKTDMTLNTGLLSVEEGAESVVRLALLPNGGPSGCFFRRQEESAF